MYNGSQPNKSDIVATSEFCKKLYGEQVPKYTALLLNEKKRILEKYPDKYLERELSNFENKIISLMPMALCDSTLIDLGIKAPDSLLAGLGMVTYHISPHDDIVDQPPNNNNAMAALLYAGNIVLLEGIESLLKNGHEKVMPSMLAAVRENHFRQQKIVDILWQKRRPTSDEYQIGIKHIISFTMIGITTALAYADKQNLEKEAWSFSEDYGMALQYFDDMSEIDEDQRNGYWSLPKIRASEKGIEGFEKDRETKNLLISELKDLAKEKVNHGKTCMKDFNAVQSNLSRLGKIINEFSY